jgi:hypothetical protein
MGLQMEGKGIEGKGIAILELECQTNAGFRDSRLVGKTAIKLEIIETQSLRGI